MVVVIHVGTSPGLSITYLCKLAYRKEPDAYMCSQEIDLARGRCSGDMMAENVPQAPAPVITHWEGEALMSVTLPVIPMHAQQAQPKRLEVTLMSCKS